MDTKTRTLDGAQLAVINSRLEGAARKMANTLLRTGRSGVLNRARDFSCCIVSAQCELVASAESLPIHVLSGADIMARHMLEFHPQLKAGDAYLNNSPYHGCSHAADHTILVPVVDDQGIHRFTMVAKAHQCRAADGRMRVQYRLDRNREQGAILRFHSMRHPAAIPKPPLCVEITDVAEGGPVGVMWMSGVRCFVSGVVILERPLGLLEVDHPAFTRGEFVARLVTDVNDTAAGAPDAAGVSQPLFR